MADNTRMAVKASQLREMLERQGYKCALSGIDLTPSTASLDHKTPVGRGGPHAIGNLWILDSRVNVMKGTLLPEEFIDLCRKVVAHANGTVPPSQCSIAPGLPDGPLFATNGEQ